LWIILCVILIPGCISSTEKSWIGGVPINNAEKIEKVKNAMLAMQRHNWEQGVAAQALLELGETDLAIQMAIEAAHRQGDDGRLAVIGFNDAVTDPAASGEALLYAAKITNDSKLKQAADKMLDYLLNKAPKTDDGILHHTTRKPQVWIDSMYMAPPFLAVAGHRAEAVKQIEGFRKRLWNPEKKLYSHIWNEDTRTFERKAFWGVGNGWTAAGIARVIKTLPEDMADEKQRLIKYLKEGIDGCLAYQRKDGLFHDVINDPNTFVETNLSQMLAYSIYRGVDAGWLDNKYLKHAHKMREAVQAKVDAFGLVQDVCGAPFFNAPGTAPEGQAFFLLMEAAARDAGY